MKRRDFIKTTSILGGGYAFAGSILSRYALNQNDLVGGDTWFDRPMRWAQLTLVENDPGNYDPDFWLEYFKRIHADGACLSAGGIVAYYPTDVPLHYRSAWLGDSDPLGYLIDGRSEERRVGKECRGQWCHEEEK